MARLRFRQLAHTADLRLSIWGDTEEDLIRNAVAGVTRLALGNGTTAHARVWERIEPWDTDLAWQLVKTANEAVFHLFVRGMRAVDFRTTPAGPELGLAPLPSGRFPEMEIKAITFHDLHPWRENGGLRAVLTLDV